MVTSADMQFWTGMAVTEEDATRYTAAVLPEFQAAGGDTLPPATRTEALCYLIAGKLDNAGGNAYKQSESLGGYSYSRMAGTRSSRWLELYDELLHPFTAAEECGNGGIVQRSDTKIVQLNRRYTHGRFF